MYRIFSYLTTWEGKIFLQTYDDYPEQGSGMGEGIGVTGECRLTLDKMILTTISIPSEFMHTSEWEMKEKLLSNTEPE